MIHTDLKPENVIVNLTEKELQEIVSRGQISTMNKNVRSVDVESLFKSKPVTEKANDGLTKQQKKKIKRKMKK